MTKVLFDVANTLFTRSSWLLWSIGEIIVSICFASDLI